MRTWKLWIFRRFSPEPVVTAFLVSLFWCRSVSERPFRSRVPGLLPADHRWRPAAAGPPPSGPANPPESERRRCGAWAQDTSHARPHGRGKPDGRKQGGVLDTKRSRSAPNPKRPGLSPHSAEPTGASATSLLSEILLASMYPGSSRHRYPGARAQTMRKPMLTQRAEAGAR